VGLDDPRGLPPRIPLRRFAYYDRRADIVWFATDDSSDVFNEEFEWGLIDRDVETEQVVAVEIWGASKRLPADLLDRMPPVR
jgi:uncharacterized protein YuzE